MIKTVCEKLKASGIPMQEAVLSLAIQAYTDTKKNELLLGNSVEEPGIGVVNPSWRRVSDAFATTPYTSKLKISIDSSLKSEMNGKLQSSPEYREAVGAGEL